MSSRVKYKERIDEMTVPLNNKCESGQERLHAYDDDQNQTKVILHSTIFHLFLFFNVLLLQHKAEMKIEIL